MEIEGGRERENKSEKGGEGGLKRVRLGAVSRKVHDEACRSRKKKTKKKIEEGAGDDLT